MSDIKIKVLYDDNQVKTGIKDTERTIKQSSDSMASSIGAVVTALGGFTILNQIKGFAIDSAKAFNTQAQAEAKLNAVIKATGGVAGITANEVKKMASELQKVTTIGDETIINAQAMLLTFKSIGSDVFPRATKAMLDMSAMMDGDLKGASIQLGKALNDPTQGISALSRVGVQFTNEQENMIRVLQESGQLMKAQEIILKELESQFGGTAEAIAKAGTGPYQQLANAFSDFKENYGEMVLNTLENGQPYWATAIKQAQEFYKVNKNIVDDTYSGVIADQNRKIAEAENLKLEMMMNYQGKKIFADTEEAKRMDAIIARHQTIIDNLKKVEQAEKASNTGQVSTGGSSESVKKEIQSEREMWAIMEADNQARASKEAEERVKREEDKMAMAERSQEQLREQLATEAEIRRQAGLNDLAILEENAQMQKALDEKSANDKIALQEKIRQANLRTITDTMMMTGAGFNFARAIAGKNKGLARTEAYVMGALAIQKAWASAPFPANIPAVTTTTLNTGANIATIESAKYKDGGLIAGNSFSGDKVPILANSGELILNQAQQNNIANQMTKPAPVFNFNIGSVTRETMPDLKKNLQEMADNFRDLIRNGYLNKTEFV